MKSNREMAEDLMQWLDIDIDELEEIVPGIKELLEDEKRGYL